MMITQVEKETQPMTQQMVTQYPHHIKTTSALNDIRNIKYLRPTFTAIALCAATVPSHVAALPGEQIQNTRASNNNLANNAKPVTNVDVVELSGSSNLINVLANDSDPDGDRLVLTDAVAKFGAVAFTRDGLIGYAQNPGKPRSDKITYIASDGRGGFATGTLEVVTR